MNHSQPSKPGTPESGDSPHSPAESATARSEAQEDETTRIAGSEAADAATRMVESEEILQGAQELIIKHQGAVYRLRRTRNGKLILHK